MPFHQFEPDQITGTTDKSTVCVGGHFSLIFRIHTVKSDEHLLYALAEGGECAGSTNVRVLLRVANDTSNRLSVRFGSDGTLVGVWKGLAQPVVNGAVQIGPFAELKHDSAVYLLNAAPGSGVVLGLGRLNINHDVLSGETEVQVTVRYGPKGWGPFVVPDGETLTSMEKILTYPRSTRLGDLHDDGGAVIGGAFATTVGAGVNKMVCFSFLTELGFTSPPKVLNKQLAYKLSTPRLLWAEGGNLGYATHIVYHFDGTEHEGWYLGRPTSKSSGKLNYFAFEALFAPSSLPANTMNIVCLTPSEVLTADFIRSKFDKPAMLDEWDPVRLVCPIGVGEPGISAVNNKQPVTCSCGVDGTGEVNDRRE